MSETIIQVENLGKKYVIPRGGAKRSDTFRDALMNGFRRFGNRVRHPWRFAKENAEREEFWALKDVSFDVKRGEVLGIIGRNGAGKSTLLKILSRITEPVTGRITINGSIASLLEVGTGFHPELSGRENIFLSGAILGMKRMEIRRQFDEIVGFAEVERFVDTPIKHYSSGMQMRLAFAVAAQLNPEILVIDEVLAVGDANFQKKCLGKMSDVARGGRTILFVSHNQGAVQNLCTRAILLNHGRLLYDGGVDEAFTRYAAFADDVATGIADLTQQARDPRFQRRHALLRSLSLLDANRTPSETIVMGQSCSFVLEADFLQVGDGYEIGLGVTSFHGVGVHYLISNWEGFETIPRLGRQQIEICLPRVHLFPGSYQVSVWIKLQGTIHDDAVHDALRFTVVEGNFTPGPAYFTRYTSNTQVYVPTIWRFGR